VATVAGSTPAAEALGLLKAQGFGPVLVLNQAGWSWAPPTGTSWRPPPETLRWDCDAVRYVTVRPSGDAAALAHRMGDRQVTRVVVTRSDGTLAGLFFAADVPPAPGCP
jgi:hypothetical protein